MFGKGLNEKISAMARDDHNSQEVPLSLHKKNLWYFIHYFKKLKCVDFRSGYAKNTFSSFMNNTFSVLQCKQCCIGSTFFYRNLLEVKTVTKAKNLGENTTSSH